MRTRRTTIHKKTFILRRTNMTMKPILTITGSDGAGGAGIQADIKAISQLGCNALTVVTSLTLQNSIGIQDYYDIPAEIVERQINAVVDDFMPEVVKIGMVRNVNVLEAIIRCIKRFQPTWVLFSPVVYSSHEDLLMSGELIEAIQRSLTPLCSAIVVRERDVDYFSGCKFIVADNSHGRCNELCSTIAVLLNQGLSMEEAEKKAQQMLPTVVNTEVTGRSLSLYKELLERIEQENKNSHDVNYYAAQLNVTPRYLSQITRKVANQSPKSIIDNSLLNRIKKELSNNDITIQQIAYELEFSSQAHLTNFFKRFTGTTPSEYRKFANQ